MEPKTIQLDQGSGGRASHELISELFVAHFRNDFLDPMNDSAVLQIHGTRLAMTTDSYVVDPVVFPGGDIGSLAVHGTVNDLAMLGAEPLYLTAGFILEEGLDLETLRYIVSSMSLAAKMAGIHIVAGDTKVVPRGKADKLFINTAGIGVIPAHIQIDGSRARPGDAVLVSGTLGDHGMAVLCQREGLAFETEILSDSAPLHDMVARILDICPNLHVLRDPTRGGLATTLNEIAQQSRVGIRLFEEMLPIREDVAGACEMLGLDPLYVANEGKLIAIMPAEYAESVLRCIRSHPLGANAMCIGEVTDAEPGRVFLRTRIGGHRLIDMLRGEQLPRIC